MKKNGFVQFLKLNGMFFLLSSLLSYSAFSICKMSDGPDDDDSYYDEELPKIRTSLEDQKPKNFQESVVQIQKGIEEDQTSKVAVQGEVENLRRAIEAGASTSVDVERMAHQISKDEYQRCYKKALLFRHLTWGEYTGEAAMPENFFQKQVKAEAASLEKLTTVPAKKPEALGQCANEAKFDTHLAKKLAKYRVYLKSNQVELGPKKQRAELMGNLIEKSLGKETVNLSFQVDLSTISGRVEPVLTGSEVAQVEADDLHVQLKEAERCYAKAYLVIQNADSMFTNLWPGVGYYAHQQLEVSRNHILWIEAQIGRAE